MAGDAIDETDEQGNAITDDTLLVLLNAHGETVHFVLPALHQNQGWTVVLDSQEVATGNKDVQKKAGEPFTLEARSLAILACESVEKKSDR